MRIIAWFVLVISAPLVSAQDKAPVPHAIVSEDISPVPNARVWKHPSEWAPESIARWFRGLPSALQYSEMRFTTGDDRRWAEPEWDDRAWRTMGFWDLPARTGIYWTRFRVRMGGNGTARMPSGVMLTSVIAFEVFWDGVLLGNSGVPGNNRETEVPGRVDNLFSVPAGLLGPGEHVVAIRASSYRCGFPSPKSGIRFLIDSPAVLQGKAVREAIVPTIAAGAMFMVGMASLIMWLLAERRSALLILAGMCAGIAVMQSLHSIRWFFQYPADWHHPAMIAMMWLVAVQAVCMVAFVMVHFALPGRRGLLSVTLLLLGLATWLSPERKNLEGVFILDLGVAISLVCALWAAARKRRDAWPAVAGLVLSAILLALEQEDFRTNFFVKFLPAMLGLMGSMALHLHDERRRAQAAKLAAARLELEVLKKNIQPHFLLNTLATIMETIEQEPRTAAELVEALAGEFRILSRVAGEKLIPLAQEVELCRAHLRVMSLRKSVECALVVDAADNRAPVPPAVFHTLVENGLTHLLPLNGRLDFELRAERDDSRMRYTLIARGGRQSDLARTSQNGSASRLNATRAIETPATEGTGLRYIKARLEESFTGCWTLESTPAPEGWKTVIEIEGANFTSLHSASVVAVPPLPAAGKTA